MSKEKKFLEILENSNDWLRPLIDDYLIQMSAEERIIFLCDLFFEKAQTHNDDAAAEILDILEKAFEYVECGKTRFIAYIKKVYWEIPAANRDVVNPTCTLQKTKNKILDHILRIWTPEVTAESIDAFRFIVAMYYPSSENVSQFIFSSTREEKKFPGLEIAIFEEDRKRIILAMRHHTATYFRSKDFENWLLTLAVGNAPDEIASVLYIGRARAGGLKLAWADTYRSFILGEIEVTQLSGEAMEKIKCKAKEIALQCGLVER